LLFVLFTAAGTSLLMIGGVSANRAPVDATATSADATTAVPTATAQSPDDQQPFESPTAPTSHGPTGGVTGMRPAPPSWQNSSAGPNWYSPPSPDGVPSIARTETITNSAVQTADSTAEPDRLPLSKPFAAEQPARPYPTTDFAPTMLLDWGDGPPPQVRTHDPTPAVARLRGDIGNVSPR
jgi:hypothetical protein